MGDTLSKRDKQAIQLVTRYSDVMREVKFEFGIRFGRVRFGKPGTTSHAEFTDCERDDAKAVERYAARLAVFAFRRLTRKHGNSCRWMIGSQVPVSGNKSYTLNLGELVEENFGESISDVISNCIAGIVETGLQCPVVRR